ncbi:hypothetical protein [uncultured Tateyamaria sp.]|uniref:hypothetical protein n=1 Tax=uncultured Tateyamaria sp. TaxID=455651 RepID=UPI002622FC63|nr:hypothetical protein [uncultured Tateyamaria sp.]
MGTYVNLFIDGRGATTGQDQKQIIRACAQKIRSRDIATGDANLDGIRIIECASENDKRPANINLLSGLLTQVADIFSDEIPCRMFELRYADSSQSPFSAGVDLIGLAPMFSGDGFVDNIAVFADLLDADDLSVDMAAIRDDFPEAEDMLEQTMGRLKETLEVG